MTRRIPCGTYHRRGREGCTSHHTRVDFLDSILKMYIQKVKQGNANMIEALEASIRDEKAKIGEGKKTQNMLRRQIDAAKNQLKVLTRQKIAELMRKPDQEKMINETYDALEAECYGKIRGLESQLDLITISFSVLWILRNIRNTFPTAKAMRRSAVSATGCAGKTGCPYRHLQRAKAVV